MDSPRNPPTPRSEPGEGASTKALDWGDYALIDFGGGRKLERFGPVVLDRPCPSCEVVPLARPSAWQQATARYERSENRQGSWHSHGALPQEWTVRLAGLEFQLCPTPFGHVGVFVEQLSQWAWITQQLRSRQQPVRMLNLFGYTGGSTLAAAKAGAEVVHVDAAQNMVRRARANATLSGLADAPIRWIVEDAAKYCRRELRRGNRYEAIILDPPSYGTGPHGEHWRIGRDLEPMLELCAELRATDPALLLVTCHTTGVTSDQLASQLAARCGIDLRRIDAGTMHLTSDDRRRLGAGVYVRWSAG